ncbi:16S rRNA pseudouridine516 synthase [Lachnospiraceae bacterium]|nr:16S rRNA pseudouridine516 synthase [Lachnospiraceae bacterium]
MRLDKFLADMGAGSRSDLKSAIRKKRVTVNGEVVRDSSMAVTENDTVTLDGITIEYETMQYFLMNKPAGVITATEDKKQETVLDLLPLPHRTDLFPVGRLDRDTEGLLLITNDGDLNHRLLSPKHHVDKVYYARIDGEVTNDDVQKFAEGIMIDDDEGPAFKALPAVLRILSAENGSSEIEVTLQEGKYHEVKRLFRAVGKRVTYLRRIAMGSLTLDPALAPGESRKLTAEEIETLQSFK